MRLGNTLKVIFVTHSRQSHRVLYSNMAGNAFFKKKKVRRPSYSLTNGWNAILIPRYPTPLERTQDKLVEGPRPWKRCSGPPEPSRLGCCIGC